MAAIYRNQIKNGSDNKISNASTQFSMARDTLAASYGGKCQVKAAGWGMNMDEISHRIQAMRTASQETQRQIKAPMDAPPHCHALP